MCEQNILKIFITSKNTQAKYFVNMYNTTHYKAV